MTARPNEPAATGRRILMVDDEENVLSAYQRTLRKRYDITTALGGAQGLARIAEEHREGREFAVIVSDMQMPAMHGIEFLRQVRQRAPESVRMALTGHGDFKTAIDAVNEGCIFRFLTKPCPPENLAQALDDGLEQYRLRRTEKDLLEKTLIGSIRLLNEILSMIDSESFGLLDELKENALRIGRELGLEKTWNLEMAAMFCRVGLVGVPPEILARSRTSSVTLSSAEASVISRVPEVGHKLLRHLPRLEGVARIVQYQAKHWDGTGPPFDSTAGADIPIEARILSVLNDTMALVKKQGIDTHTALATLRHRIGLYDPAVIDAAQKCLPRTGDGATPSEDASVPIEVRKRVPLQGLADGMMIADNIVTSEGKVLLRAGRVVSSFFLERLRNYALVTSIREPITVFAPASPGPSSEPLAFA